MGRRKRILFLVLSFSTGIWVWLSNHWGTDVMALPPPEDTPEEILRTEIIVDARSPIDGKPLNAAEYLELQEQLQQAPRPRLDSKIREQVFLLRIRKTLLQLFPFLDL